MPDEPDPRDATSDDSAAADDPADDDDSADAAGRFWRTADGGPGEPPPAVITLGGRVVRADAERGESDVTFEARPEFLNSMGGVQGGFLAAMLDTTLASALICTLPPGAASPTVALNVSYLRPAPPGRLFGYGRVVHRGRSIAFLAGELRDGAGQVLATATGTATVRLPR